MGARSRPGLLASLRSANTWANRHAGVLFLAGLAGVAAFQWRQWQKDKMCLAQVHPPPPLPALGEWPRLPKVSALVAAWNEAEHIQTHIKSFLALHYPHKQLVLVAGGTDATFELAQQYAGEQVVVLPQIPGEGKQRALRRGLAATAGGIIYLTDADCLFDNSSFERVIFPIANGEEQAVTGTSKPSLLQMQNAFVFSQAATQIYSAFHIPRYATGLLGRNCAILRSMLVQSRGLDAEASTGTDYVLAKMLGLAGVKIRQEPHSMLVSDYPSRLADYLRQQQRWLWNVWHHGRQFGETAEIRSTWLNIVIGAAMLMLPAMACLLGPLILVLWGVLIAYAWLSRIRYSLFAESVVGMRLKSVYWIQFPFLLMPDFIVWASALTGIFHKRARWG